MNSSRRAAVTIGINYDHFPKSVPPQKLGWIAPLKYAEADARDMAEILTESGYEVMTLLGVQATRTAIQEAIKTQADLVGADGILLVHFSGHGGLENEVAYLLPVDALPGKFFTSALRFEDLVNRDLARGPFAVALLDCCHSGDAVGVRNGGAADDGSRAYAATVSHVIQMMPGGAPRKIVAACAGAQVAHEKNHLQHGVFTYYVLDHWRTYADAVTVYSLIPAVQAGLNREQVAPLVEGGTSQPTYVLRPAFREPPPLPPPPLPPRPPRPRPITIPWWVGGAGVGLVVLLVIGVLLLGGSGGEPPAPPTATAVGLTNTPTGVAGGPTSTSAANGFAGIWKNPYPQNVETMQLKIQIRGDGRIAVEKTDMCKQAVQGCYQGWAYAPVKDAADGALTGLQWRIPGESGPIGVAELELTLQAAGTLAITETRRFTDSQHSDENYSYVFSKH